MVWFNKCTLDRVPWNRVYVKEKLLDQKADRNKSVSNVHYQLASTYGPVHLSLYAAEGAHQVVVNPVSDDLSVQSSASSCEHSIRFSPLLFRLWASKAGNDISLQPGLISYILCLSTEHFPLSALPVLEARHAGGLVWIPSVATAIFLAIWRRIAGFWTVSGLKCFTDCVATTEMRRWSNECHRREEIEYCHLNFLCFGQSQEAAYADAGTRLFHTLCLSESYKSDGRLSFMPWTSRLSSPYNLIL